MRSLLLSGLVFACGDAGQPTPSPPVPAAVGSGCVGAAADGFDLPVGPPDATGYYDAQPFGTNRHLGNDWNGLGGGNTDFGDPVYVVANGVVTEVADVEGGWGLVVRMAHPVEGGCVESLYAHLSAAEVELGDPLRRGDRVGAIGDANGRYLAHLHFELRAEVGLPLGGGYGAPAGHVDGTAFIVAHRPKR